MNWEEICSDTSRLKVYGGWLIRYTYEYMNGYGVACHSIVTFISDKDHNWTIEK